MSKLHSRTAEHDPSRPEPPVPAASEVNRVGLLTEQIADAVRAAPLGLLRRAGSLGGLLRPWEAASSAMDARPVGHPHARAAAVRLGAAEVPRRARGTSRSSRCRWPT